MIGAWFAQIVPQAQKTFWTYPMVLLGNEAQVDARFGKFGDVLIFTQDRCMVYAKCMMCSVIILDAPDCTPG